MRQSATVVWVHTNVGSRGAARRLAQKILESRLAACANMWPIDSSYWWEGALVRASEIAVVFKAPSSNLARLVEAVRRSHPYKVPYVAWGRGERVLPTYARWVKREAAAHPVARAARGRPRTRRKT